MKIQRTLTPIAVGLLGISLLLSPLACSGQPEGTPEGEATPAEAVVIEEETAPVEAVVTEEETTPAEAVGAEEEATPDEAMVTEEAVVTEEETALKEEQKE